MSATPFALDNETVILGRTGHTFRQQLVGCADFSGHVNGKFAGYATPFGPSVAVHQKW